MLDERALVDAYTRRALLQIRVAYGLGADAVSRLRALAKELRALLIDTDLSTLGRHDLNALLRRIEAAIAACYDDIEDEFGDSLDDVADEEHAWALGFWGRIGASAGLLDGLLLLGLPLARHWRRQRANATDRIVAAIRNAAATGQAPAEVVRAIIGDGPRGRERGGALGTARTQAQTVIHSGARAAAMAAQRAAWKAAGVKFLKWHSILDTRTTIGCAVRAGKLYTIDLQPVGHDIPMGVEPPAHFNCRSILVPMAPDFVPPGDGQDPYTESLDRWLQRQPEAVQDELLGKGRAAAWRAGILRARDLLGQGGETLSIEELRAAGKLGTAYHEARAGGRYAKFLVERETYSDSQLAKSARSYERTIAQHEAWIANPGSKLPPDTPPEEVKRLVEKKWPADIRRNKAYLDIVKGILGART